MCFTFGVAVKIHEESKVRILAGPHVARLGKGGRELEMAATVGVLSFEEARLMSKAVQLWQALGDDRLGWMRDVALSLEGVRSWSPTTTAASSTTVAPTRLWAV